MTHTIKDILREGIEEFRKEIGEVPNGDAFLLENFQTGDKMCITCGHPANPNTRIEQLADWLKAHDQKLLQAVIDTARGMKKSEHEEPHEMADQKRWDLWESMSSNDEIYNQALDDLIASITPIEV